MGLEKIFQGPLLALFVEQGEAAIGKKISGLTASEQQDFTKAYGSSLQLAPSEPH